MTTCEDATIGLASGLALHRDAVLDLGAHHPAHAHGREPTRCGATGSVGDDGRVDRARRAPADRRGAVAATRSTSCARRACAGLHGRVLEIGFGSGLNLPHLPAEVDVGRRGRAVRRRLGALRAAPRPQRGPGASGSGSTASGSTADDASYDAVLSTFTLCTIPDAAAGPGRGTPGAAARRHAALPRARPRARRRRGGAGSAGSTRCSGGSSPAAT